MTDRKIIQLALDDDERRAVSGLIWEMAGRLEREKKPAAKKQAERYREIAREVRGFANGGIEGDPQ